MLTAGITLFILGTLADHFSTKRALSLGAKELNPVGRWIIEKAGFAGLMVFNLAIVSLAAWFLATVGGITSASIFLMVAGVAKLLAGWRNWRVGDRLEKKQS